MLKVVETYRVEILKSGTGNTWVKFANDSNTLEEATAVMQDALYYNSQVKIKRITEVVQS